MRTLNIGLIGVGQGAANVLPTMNAMPEYTLVAVADINPRMRAAAVDRYGVRAYETIDEICADKELDAVWVSTPNKYHCPHAVALLRAGKHVIVEKPMAVTLEEADQMVAVAKENDRRLVAAHTNSYSPSVRVMRKLALTRLGKVRSILIWSYTDWMLRARTAEELSPEAGAGMVHRQAPHQVDTLRLLGGGKLRSVRGQTGQWMAERPVPGFYTAFMEFEDGTPATIMHNGYGYFMHGHLFEGSLDRHRYTDADRVAIRKALRTGSRDEDMEKESFRIGGSNDPTKGERQLPTWSPGDLGMLLVSCEHGDMRHSKYGVYVHGDEGTEDYDMRTIMRNVIDLEGGATTGALGELYDSVTTGVPVYHSGEWGRATLEATIAIERSARERREIMLERQVEMPASYDAALTIPEAVTTA